RADQRRDCRPARSGDEHPAVPAVDPEIRFETAEELQRLLRLLGFVPLVVGPDDPIVCRVDGDCLHRRGTDIDTDEQLGRHDHTPAPAGARFPAAAIRARDVTRAKPGRRRRPIRLLTWSTKFAAVPVTPSTCGTR